MRALVLAIIVAILTNSITYARVRLKPYVKKQMELETYVRTECPDLKISGPKTISELVHIFITENLQGEKLFTDQGCSTAAFIKLNDELYRSPGQNSYFAFLEKLKIIQEDVVLNGSEEEQSRFDILILMLQERYEVINNDYLMSHLTLDSDDRVVATLASTFTLVMGAMMGFRFNFKRGIFKKRTGNNFRSSFTLVKEMRSLYLIGIRTLGTRYYMNMRQEELGNGENPIGDDFDGVITSRHNFYKSPLDYISPDNDYYDDNYYERSYKDFVQKVSINQEIASILIGFSVTEGLIYASEVDRFRYVKKTAMWLAKHRRLIMLGSLGVGVLVSIVAEKAILESAIAIRKHRQESEIEFLQKQLATASNDWERYLYGFHLIEATNRVVDFWSASFKTEFGDEINDYNEKVACLPLNIPSQEFIDGVKNNRRYQAVLRRKRSNLSNPKEREKLYREAHEDLKEGLQDVKDEQEENFTYIAELIKNSQESLKNIDVEALKVEEHYLNDKMNVLQHHQDIDARLKETVAQGEIARDLLFDLVEKKDSSYSDIYLHTLGCVDRYHLISETTKREFRFF